MFWLMPQPTVQDTIAFIDELADACGSGDDLLGVWGLTMGMDGGVEGGFLGQPYASDLGLSRSCVLGSR